MFCATDQPRFVLLNAKRLTIAPVAGTTNLDSFEAMGKYWLKGATAREPGGQSLVLYLNWRSGQRVEADPAEDAKAPRDLDRPGLPAVPVSPFAGAFLYGHASGDSVVSPISGRRAGGVYLLHGRSPTPLDRRCVVLCGGSIVPFAGRTVNWVVHGRRHDWLVHSYALRTRRTRTWRVHGIHAPPNPVIEVAAATAGGRLFIEILTKTRLESSSGDFVPAGYRIYLARR